MPQSGDADDGRLYVLSAYDHRSPQDGRHLFGPAGAIFGRADWVALAGDQADWETAWWGLSAPAAESAALASRLFPDAGLAVMRAGDGHYLLASNGIVGTKGFGNHKHNDLLSFEYHHGGVPLLVDPGSYVYTSDFAARNRFRSTAYHNTVQVDGVEQNETNPEWIFRLFETSNAEHVAFTDSDQSVEYTGRHHGYERLSQPVTHERTLRLMKKDGSLVMVDRMTGAGEHELRWHFHLAPGVTATAPDANTVVLSAQGRRWRLSLPDGVATAIVAAEYSPSYGVAIPCQAVDASLRVTLDGTRSWSISITS
jgi:hypothetical protein